MPKAADRIREYDGLKGIAILGIMLVHFMSWSGAISINDMVKRWADLGAYGVEITFILNAVLMSKSFIKWKALGGGICHFIFKNILRIFPVYYLGLTMHLIAERVTLGKIVQGKFVIFLHYTFLHGLSPLYWDAFGMGYMGVLFVMWVLFPLYIRNIGDFKSALITGIFTCVFAGVCYNLAIMYSPLDEAQRWYAWLHYILRGVYCYSIGPIAYYAQKELPFDNLKLSSKVFFTFVFFAYVILNVSIYRVDYLTYSILIAVIIWLIPSKFVAVLRFPIFVFAGDHIFELFISHVTLFYVIVIYLKPFNSVKLRYSMLVMLSFISAVLIKKFFVEPINKCLAHRNTKR